MIGPKQTTNEQMSNETKPMMGHESSAQSPGRQVEENRDVSERRNLSDDAGMAISFESMVWPTSIDSRIYHHPPPPPVYPPPPPPPPPPYPPPPY